MRLTYPVRVPRVSDGEQCTHHWLLCPSAPWPTYANLYFSRTIDMTPTPTLTFANIWHTWCQSILRQEKCEGSSRVLVKSESARAWKVSNEFVESWIGSNCIKGTAAPLNSLKKTSVTSRRHLNLNVERILRNEGLPKTPSNFTSIRYLCVDTELLWLLDILRCCVLLELSQTQRL